MCTPMSITALFTIAKLSVHQKMSSGMLLGHMKKINPIICNKMDGARGHYAQ